MAKTMLEAIRRSADRWDLGSSTVTTVIAFPFVVTFLFALALTIPFSRDAATEMLSENRPVELLTTVFLLIAAVVAVQLVRMSRRAEAPTWVVAFYGLFALAGFLVAMEEIAWGQWLLGFETPEAMSEINRQNELTIHNVEGFHGRTEFLRMTFGLGGLFGVWLGFRETFRRVAPPLFLVGWFVVIVGLAIPDLTNDLFGLDGSVWALFDYLSELNEFLIALVSLIFLWLLKDHWRQDEVPVPVDRSVESAS